jgi:uncharacterized membrane protein
VNAACDPIELLVVIAIIGILLGLLLLKSEKGDSLLKSLSNNRFHPKIRKSSFAVGRGFAGRLGRFGGTGVIHVAGASASSRMWRPVMATKTSSSLTCRVVRRDSVSPRPWTRSSNAGIPG